jgi:hypothetical protein
VGTRGVRAIDRTQMTKSTSPSRAADGRVLHEPPQKQWNSPRRDRPTVLYEGGNPAGAK